MTSRRIRVVAALIERGDEVLVSRRRDRPGKPGLWEFPGGKLEPGESEAEALARELKEELGVAATPGALFAHLVHSYSGLTVELVLLHATISDTEVPRALEAEEVRWVPRRELPSLPFLEADVELVRQIAAGPN